MSDSLPTQSSSSTATQNNVHSNENNAKQGGRIPIIFTCDDNENDTTKEKSQETNKTLKNQRSQNNDASKNYLSILPKYIFEKDHSILKSVDTILEKISKDENQNQNMSFQDGEVSEYPIEYYENQQHAIQRHMNVKPEIPDPQITARHQHLEHTLLAETSSILYNRIHINDDPMGAEIEDLLYCAELLVKAMIIREKYMVLSLQSFPFTTAKYLNKIFAHDANRRSSIFTLDAQEQQFLDTIEDDTPINPPPREGDPFEIEFLPNLKCKFENKNGVIHVLNENDQEDAFSSIIYPDLKMFIDDYVLMVNLIGNGPLKTFCYRRLRFLKSKYELHCMLNELKEFAQQKAVPHRDFYNSRKVDTHVHASSMMNQKHLLRFIKKKMKTSSEMIVLNDKVKGPMRLKDVFDEINLTPFDLSIDKLDMHAHGRTFHRFDKFNAKYNPIGMPKLRDIFIKVDNDIDGVFYAELLKEVMSDIEDSKYQNAEPRLSMYGRKANEWDALAKWAVTNKMYSPNIMWLIQIPRLYDVFRANNLIANFNEIINNIFMPLFEVTSDPESHPDLHKFLAHVSGFDSVDDESKPERDIFNMSTPLPQDWNTTENPPYVYYMYYMYANIQVLNHFRRERGLNTFDFRPHSGEAGAVNHLIAAYMLGNNISHGLVLRKVPVLLYLFYLCQIGIAMSPLSNNSLFLNYIKNPFYEYHTIGLNVSLSTDDPLQFHFTKEPLMEEYSIAAQVWKMSSVDMCEISRNSVVMSGFPKTVKKHWLGANYKKEGIKGNDTKRTNIPDIRVAFRYETLVNELKLLVDAINQNNTTTS